MPSKRKKGRSGLSDQPACDRSQYADFARRIYARLQCQEDVAGLLEEVDKLHAKGSGELSDPATLRSRPTLTCHGIAQFHVTLHCAGPESWLCLAKLHLQLMVNVLQSSSKESTQNKHAPSYIVLRSKLQSHGDLALSASRQGINKHKSALCAVLYSRLLQGCTATHFLETLTIQDLSDKQANDVDQASLVSFACGSCGILLVPDWISQSIFVYFS